MKGVPCRVEIGPRDLLSGEVSGGYQEGARYHLRDHTFKTTYMGCRAAEATGLGFVFVVINPRVLSADRVDFGLLCFINFSILLPPPPSDACCDERQQPEGPDPTCRCRCWAQGTAIIGKTSSDSVELSLYPSLSLRLVWLRWWTVSVPLLRPNMRYSCILLFIILYHILIHCRHPRRLAWPSRRPPSGLLKAAVSPEFPSSPWVRRGSIHRGFWIALNCLGMILLKQAFQGGCR